ncbi:hypothetical protein FBUS_06905 [Fasciolopsis buskii]|uniref:C2H2-type domain-containing protein n=1 Tax=Fasciolopsis buskii TaxID=27845 RepID=A0A8E0VIH7_9TREM|nr:hypothetical protein FBUS_06905 [Fasciolopsis buski]
MSTCSGRFSGPSLSTEPVFQPVNRLIAHSEKPFLFNIDSDELLSCSECGARAGDYSILMVHYVSCHRYVCGVCGLCFVSPELLSVHEMGHNTGFRYKVACPLPQCPDRFDSREEVSNHMQSRHCLSLRACGLE